MSTVTSSTATTPGSATTSRPPSRARRLAWPVALTLLIAGSITVIGYAFQVNRMQREAATHNQQRLVALEQQLHGVQAELATQRGVIQHTEMTVQALHAELAALDERTTHTEAAASTARAATTPDPGDTLTDLHLDQIELLLLLAQQRAQHDADISGARALYAQADALLARLPATPPVAALRHSLAAEFGVLRAWSETTPAHTAAVTDTDTATAPEAADPPDSRTRPWWQRILAHWIDIRPTTSTPEPAPADAALPAPPADHPALGSTLTQLRAQRHAD